MQGSNVGPILKAIRLNTTPDDPLLIIYWNDAAFNDNPAVPNCRNGIPGQNRTALVNHIKNNGGTEVLTSGFIFRFANSQAIYVCERALPMW